MKILIVGAGISGLTIAYRLLGKGFSRNDLMVLDAGKKPGGKICAIGGDGFTVDGGPNGFLDSKPAAVELCQDLGLSNDLLPSSDAARKRFVYSSKQLHQLPESPPAFLKSKLLSAKGKLRLMMEPFIGKNTSMDDETLAHFARRRLGNEAYEKLLDPMVSGIFAGNPEYLSLRASFPRIWEIEQEYGSLIKGMIRLAADKSKKKTGGGAAGPGGKLTSFKTGFTRIIEKLHEELGDIVQTNSKIASIERHGEQWKATIAGNDEEQVADILVLAIPAFNAAELLHPHSATLAATLNTIPYASATVIGFGYKKATFPNPLDGFGFLVPSAEQKEILGCLWTSSIFPDYRAPDDSVLLRIILGGMRRPDLVKESEESLYQKVEAVLQDTMGIEVKPDFRTIKKWDAAIPQYNQGHRKILEKLEEDLVNFKGLYLGGNAYKGISLPDCAKNSAELAEEIANLS